MFVNCEGECGVQFIKSQLKQIRDYEGNLISVCQSCYLFVKAEREEETEYNYVMGGNISRELCSPTTPPTASGIANIYNKRTVGEERWTLAQSQIPHHIWSQINNKFTPKTIKTIRQHI